MRIYLKPADTVLYNIKYFELPFGLSTTLNRLVGDGKQWRLKKRSLIAEW
ncbi:MAG: hypothetical protein ACFCUL_12275 [Flavobacteriaceae bacterium]